MEYVLDFDEVEIPWFGEIDDEIGLFWENDEVEEKRNPDFPKTYKHLQIVTKNRIQAK